LGSQRRGVEGRTVSEFAGYLSRYETTPNVVAPERAAEPGSQIGKRTRVDAEGYGPRSNSPATSPARQMAEPASECPPDDALSFDPPAPMTRPVTSPSVGNGLPSSVQ
jgi:hypothetical protein